MIEDERRNKVGPIKWKFCLLAQLLLHRGGLEQHFDYNRSISNSIQPILNIKLEIHLRQKVIPHWSLAHDWKYKMLASNRWTSVLLRVNRLRPGDGARSCIVQGKLECCSSIERSQLKWFSRLTGVPTCKGFLALSIGDLKADPEQTGGAVYPIAGVMITPGDPPRGAGRCCCGEGCPGFPSGHIAPMTRPQKSVGKWMDGNKSMLYWYILHFVSSWMIYLFWEKQNEPLSTWGKTQDLWFFSFLTSLCC